MSDICMLTAPIGGGKSLYAAEHICLELEASDRLIVTNVPVIMQNAPEGYMSLQEWCDKYVKDRVINVRKRVFVLTAEQTSNFWEFYPYGEMKINEMPGVVSVVNHSTKTQDCRGFRLPNVPHPQKHERDVFVNNFDLLKNNSHFPGCAWYIDEAHINFSARSFYKDSANSQKAEFYMSQLRKLNGDLDLISQDPEKVDKNFRRNVTFWMQVQNFGRTPLWMGVGVKNRFKWYRWNQAEMPDFKQKPDAYGWYKLKNREYHKVYFTMAGTGMSRGLAVTETQRFKLRSPVVWIIPLLLIIFLAFFGPKYLEAGLTSAFRHVVGGVSGSINKGVVSGLGDSSPHPSQSSSAQTVPVVAPMPVPVALPLAPARLQSDLTQERYDTAELYCKGYMYDGTNVYVMLSDGRIADSRLGDVQGIGRFWVRVFGLAPLPIRSAPAINYTPPVPQQLPGIRESARHEN